MGIATPEPFRYEQLAALIADSIGKGTLAPGGRLPSVRHMARRQGVSLSTVLQAYRVLEARGHVRAHPRSGFFVRHATPRDEVPAPRALAPRPDPAAVETADLAREVLESFADPGVVALGAAIPLPDLVPSPHLARALTRAARRVGDRAGAYLGPRGGEGLRRAIARHMVDAGCAFAADDLLVTCGCTEALSLCLRAVAGPGDVIAVESPAYYGVLQAIEALGARTLEVPTDPTHGVDAGAMEDAMRRGAVRACVVTANFQNPLGSLVPEEAKRALARAAERYGVPVIESDVYGDLHFGPERPRPVAAYDESGWVLHCGSAKAVAPALRVGWTAPGRFRAAVERLKVASTAAHPAPVQWALAELMDTGVYRQHLRRLRRAAADTLDRMSGAVAASFPPGTRIGRPRGGLVLWVELPEGTDALALYRAALRAGIGVAPGPMFSPTGGYRHHLRLSAAQAWSPGTEAALETLGRLVPAASGR